MTRETPPLHPPAPPTSLRDLAIILFRHKRSVAAILATAVACMLVWLFLIRDDVYLVSAKLLVRMGREQAAPTTMIDQRSVFIGDREQDVNSEADILHNRELLAKVVDQLHLDRPAPPGPVPRRPLAWVRYQLRRATGSVKEGVDATLVAMGLRERLTPRERAISMLESSLRVIRQKDSNVLVATMTLPQREGGSRILNALLDAYETFRLDVFQDRSAVVFFRERVQETETRLREVEEELRGLEQAGGIRAIEDQKRTLVIQIAEGQNALDAATLALRQASARVARLERALATDEPDFSAIGSFGEGSYPQKLVLDLAALQREREQLRMNELDNGPRIRNNRAQFQVLIGLLDSNLRADQSERRAEVEARRAAQARFQAQLDSLQSEHTGWSALKRSATALEESDRFFRRKLEEALATQALRRERIGNVTVIEHATDPLAPAGMRKLALLAVCVVVAGLMSLAWVTVAEFFDHRIHSPDALENRLGVPVIAAVPGPHPRPATAASPTADSESAALRNGAHGEPHRKAALFLARRVREGNGRTFLFASASPGAGTTTTAFEIARELHETCRLTVLIVQLERERSAEQGGPQGIRRDPRGFSILRVAVGSGDADPLITLRQALDPTAREYDAVLIDAPALLERTEGLMAGAIAGQVILVVESGRTRHEVLDHVVRGLEVEKVELIAGVLTKQRHVVPDWIYRRLVQ